MEGLSRLGIRWYGGTPYSEPANLMCVDVLNMDGPLNSEFQSEIADIYSRI